MRKSKKKEQFSLQTEKSLSKNNKIIYFFFSDKDIDCDIRENIINYEDEGGGEGDQTGYDLSVLRMMSDGTPALHAHDGKMHKGDFLNFQQDPPPDIQTFLQTNKVNKSKPFCKEN